MSKPEIVYAVIPVRAAPTETLDLIFMVLPMSRMNGSAGANASQAAKGSSWPETPRDFVESNPGIS